MPVALVLNLFLKFHQSLKKLSARLCIAAFITVLVAGCMSAGTNFNNKALSQFQRGKTTQSEAITLLGSQPFSTHIGPDGSSQLFWSYVSGANVKGLGVEFDSQGIFTSFTSATNVQLPLPRFIGIRCNSRLPNGDISSQITSLIEGGRAQRAGWMVGDTVVAVDGLQVSTLNEVMASTDQGYPSKSYSINRAGKVFESKLNF